MWVFLGALLGAGLTLVLLLLPPVQAWLLRRVLAAQADTTVDFSRVALGPGGAEAADVHLRLPNLTVEARALRLALSPWQLLSRRRLAIADLQARQLDIRTAAGGAPSASTPFAGLLAGIQAPLAWACANAEADGFVTLDQPGAAPIRASFELKGRDLDMERPGRLAFLLSTTSELVPGFSGEWRLGGTIDFTPAADGGVAGLRIEGIGEPAASAGWWLPRTKILFTVARTPAGEDYHLTLEPEGGDAALTLDAAYTSKDGLIAGNWHARGGSALAGRVLKRTDLPVLTTDTMGRFTLDPLTGKAEATVNGTFAGTGWERFMPELAQIGRITGSHTAGLSRHGSVWQLDRLEAGARSDGSQAGLTFTLARPVTLPPGGDDDPSPWGRLTLEKIPLGWTAPVLGVARIKDGEAGGTWAVSSPDPATLRFTPLTPFASTPFTVEDATLPALPALRLSGEARLDLTATTARLRIEPAALASEKGDRMEGLVESTADLDRYTAVLEARGTARLPTWLGAAQAPVLHGRLTADLREFDATVTGLRIAARDEGDGDDTFVAEALAPFRFDYERPEAIEFPEGNLARLTAQGLRLDWATPLLPGFSLAGRLAGGESVLRREGPGLAVATPRPWEVRGLSVVQGGLPLLLAPSFTFAPEGHVQLGADWVPGDFAGTLALGGELGEIFRLRDPDGTLTANGAATVLRTGGRLEVKSFQLTARRNDGTPLVTVESLRPLTLGTKAKDNAIDQAADTLRVRTSAVPLTWLQPLLPEGSTVSGVLEPVEFVAKVDLPNLFLTPARPLAIHVAALDDATGPQLRDLRLELSPTVIVMGNLASLVVENGRVLVSGREAGTAGFAAMYFMSNLQIPISASLDMSGQVGLLRLQPGAGTLPLPATGKARLLLEHDLIGSKEPTLTFLLEEVQSPDSGGPLPRFGARLTRLKRGETDTQDRIRLDFQYQTEPAWSAFTAEFGIGMNQGRAEINTTLKGDFFDAGRFLQLVEACTPATTEAAAPPRAKETPVPAAETAPAGAFWQTLLGRFDLEFGQVVYGDYRIENLTGEFLVNEEALDLRRLSGRMFDGAWRGRLRLGYEEAQPERPYLLSGGFAIEGFSAERIVQAAYPNEIGSFSGRLHFESTLHAQGANPRQLLADSTSAFSFRSESGRLRLQVPHSNLASAALLVGGAITFSPELRAMGRLITQFSDLPVDELSARGRSEPGGALVLDELRVSTPQLRFSARGTVPARSDLGLAARPFELPLTLTVRDEMAVILRGMKLIDKKPDADGFFAMTRRPVLRGTLGEPDTTEFYDVLAQAVAGSSGTFGFLMKKVQQEATKTRLRPQQ